MSSVREVQRVSGRVKGSFFLADFASEDCQRLLNSFLCSCPFCLLVPPLLFLFSSLNVFPLSPPFSSSIYYPFYSLPEFLSCILFPLSTTSISYCSSYFPPMFMSVMQDVPRCQLLHVFPLMPCVTDVLSRQKAPHPGLTPARLPPLFRWTPGVFRFTSDRIFLF